MTPLGALIVVLLAVLALIGLVAFATSFRPTRWGRRIAGLLVFAAALGTLLYGLAMARAVAGISSIFR